MNGPANVVSIVDDAVRLRKALTRLLQRNGFDARAFASAREFLAADGLGTNACLLLDVSMPDLDGFALQQGLIAGRTAFWLE